MDTSVSRMAPLSPPGTCVIGIDGRRHGLRLAGNVGDEGDRRTELAHRLGEGQHHAGDDARHDQRQSHDGEHPDGMSAERSRRILELAVDGCDGQADRAHQQREAHDGAGERRAGPAEGEHDAELLGQEGADGAAPAEADAAGTSRRRPAAEPRGRWTRTSRNCRPQKRPRSSSKRDGDAGNEARRHRDEGDFQAEANGRPFFRRKPIDHEPEVALPTNVKPCFSKKASSCPSAGRPGTQRRQDCSNPW